MELLQDVIIRHPKERKSKCSLEPLRDRPDLRFLTSGPGFTFDATGLILLALDAPVLSSRDAHRPLLLLDSTWRLLPSLMSIVQGEPVRRSLPTTLRTAYPRVSKIHADPACGLASVEALYAARWLQGRPVAGLLDDYHWRDTFLRQFDAS
jgi:pre-rRNA-processing protein TSR3